MILTKKKVYVIRFDFSADERRAANKVKASVFDSGKL